MIGFLLPKPSLSDQDVERGMKWLTWEGAATMGYSSITESGFLTAYALLMGANNFQIGFLAALPFLIQPTQLFMIAAVQRLKIRKALSVITWMGAQATWIPIALIPFFFGGLNALSISALLGLVSLRSLLAAARNANYNSWVRDLVPANRLGSFFSRRLTLATLASVLFGLSASFFVDYWKSQNPGDAQVYGYTIVLLVGAVFLGIAGPVFLSLVPEPKMNVPEGRRPSLADNIVMPMRDANFRHLMKFLFLRGFTANLAVPFFAVYMLERIGLSLTAVVALTVISQVFNVMFLRVWGPMADRLGSRVVLSVCNSLLLLVIFGWIFTTMPERYTLTIPLLVVLHAFAGIAMAGINVTTGAIGMKLAPRGNAAPFLAGASLATNLGAGLAPLVGGRFADFFSVRAFSISFEWLDPNGVTGLPGLVFTGYDFLFVVSFVLGLIASNTLTTITEEGEADRETVMEELTAGSADVTRAVSSIPGLRTAANLPYNYLRHVPGVDVAVGVTAYQLASSTRAATTAVGRGASSAEAIARTVSATVRSATGEVAHMGEVGAEVARHSARGVLHAATEVEHSVETLARGALLGAAHTVGRTASGSAHAVEGAAHGIVHGAHEAGASIHRAVTGTLESARDAARTLGISEREAFESMADSALVAAEQIGPEAVEEVTRAIEAADFQDPPER